MTEEYFDIKLEQFFNNFNLKEAEFTYDSNQQVKLTTTKEYAGLFVTDADLNNFSCEGKYILNRLVVKLCFLARFIDNVFKHSDSKESDVDLIQADFIELKKAIEDLNKILQ